MAGMSDHAFYRRLKRLGISAPYASQLANRRRAPGLILALRIWRATGVKLGPIEGLASAAIVRLEKLRLKGKRRT